MAVMMKMMAIVHNDPFLCAWDFQFSTFFVVSVCLSVFCEIISLFLSDRFWVEGGAVAVGVGGITGCLRRITIKIAVGWDFLGCVSSYLTCV